MKCVRFAVNNICRDSQKRVGVFQVIYDLIDEKKLSSDEEKMIKVVLKWFSKNLRKPKRFSTSSRSRAVNKAISWFKYSATEHISKIREIVAVLEIHEVMVEMTVTEKPGYIVYSDEFQVAAEPFYETKT
jgi:hypothetical protein